MAKKKSMGGRPSKYEAEWKDKLPVIQGWARDGLVDEQIARNLGIHPSTLYEWKKRYPEFAEALKKGKEVVDREVENALLKRALGYEYEETKTEVDAEGATKVTTTVKHMAPDVTAQIFWLKNRKPQEWRDRQEVQGQVVHTHEHEKQEVVAEIVNTPELAKLIAERFRQRVRNSSSSE